MHLLATAIVSSRQYNRSVWRGPQKCDIIIRRISWSNLLTDQNKASATTGLHGVTVKITLAYFLRYFFESLAPPPILLFFALF